MKYNLRPYQQEAVTIGLKALTSKSNGILMLPSGSGKSLVIAGICHAIKDPVLILQPSKEILEQNKEKLVNYGIDDIGVYSASAGEKTIGQYTLATIGSIYKKPRLFKQFKYVLFDECHLHAIKKKSMYNKFFAAIGEPKVLGLTATPFKNIQKFLRKKGNWVEYTAWCVPLNRIPPFFFRKIVYKITHQELLEQGYLCPLEYQYKDNVFDMSALKINTTGAEYTSESVETYLNLPMNVSKVISSVSDNINSCKHILVFASSLHHAENLKEALQSVYNIKADTLPGDTPKKLRTEKLLSFKAGETRVMISVGTLTTGFDFPELDCVILGRPTMSLNLYYQMICRGVRNAPNKKKCVIVDCCKNVKRFGKVETLHMGKEADGFRDTVVTETGVISSRALFSWAMKTFDWGKPKQDKLI